MTKAHVDGDLEPRGRADRYRPVAAMVEGDCGYDDGPDPWVIPGPPGEEPIVPGRPGVLGPVLAVWLRKRTGYNDDGVPEYAWAWAASSRSILYEDRSEHDAQAGHTLVKATAVMVLLREPRSVTFGQGQVPFVPASVEEETVEGVVTLSTEIGTMSVPYVGLSVPEPMGLHETMAVRNMDSGEWFDVTSYRHVDDRLELTMQRVDEG